jgi:hypothetical protein
MLSGDLNIRTTIAVNSIKEIKNNAKYFSTFPSVKFCNAITLYNFERIYNCKLRTSNANIVLINSIR